MRYLCTVRSFLFADHDANDAIAVRTVPVFNWYTLSFKDAVHNEKVRDLHPSFVPLCDLCKMTCCRWHSFDPEGRGEDGDRSPGATHSQTQSVHRMCTTTPCDRARETYTPSLHDDEFPDMHPAHAQPNGCACRRSPS